jgi:hypothetical protein
MTDVTVSLHVDTAAANLSIDEVKTKADAAVQQWRIQRMEIIQGVRETITLISTTMSTYRQFMSVIGAQVDTFYSALIGMTLSTISMLLSLATAAAATGVFATAAVIMGSIAVGLNIILIGKLIAEKEATTGMFSKMGAAVGSAIGEGLSNISPLGGRF